MNKFIVVLLLLLASLTNAFQATLERRASSQLGISIFNQEPVTEKDTVAPPTPPSEPELFNDDNDKDSAKFGFGQRFASLQCLVLGSIVGSVAVSPILAAHYFILGNFPTTDIPLNALAQFEFDIDTAAIQAGLFAIVYRYAVRTDSVNNKQLGSGVTGAFALVRTLSRVHVPTYCMAISLNCGPPFGYVDWNMLAQLGIGYTESAVLFGATASALEWAMNKRLIGRFPG